MSKIDHWIEDQLFEMTGMSDRDVVQFLKSIAKESKSKEMCFRKIQDTRTLTVEEAFTDELWMRVNGKMAETSKPAAKRPSIPDTLTPAPKMPSPKRRKEDKQSDSDSDEWEKGEKERYRH